MSAIPDGPRILFATNIERGQCGVFLAAAASLLASSSSLSPVDLHFASFPSLQDEVRALSDNAGTRYKATRAGTDASARPRITFHALRGPTHTDAVLARNAERYGPGSSVPPPAFSRPLDAPTTMATVRDLCAYLLGWDGPGFMQVYRSFADIIDAVAPDLIVVDVLLSPAISAAWNSGVRFAYLSPNSIKDFAASYQPLSMLWKWPALMSGFDYPVPWHQKPLNVFHYMYMIYQLLTDPGLATTKRHVQEETGKPLRCLMNTGKSLPDHVRIFVGTLPELDFPLTSHPRIVPCGPIIRAPPPIAESDPELAAWLARGPTVYVNLGSLFKLTEERAVELARGLNLVMDRQRLERARPTTSSLQVLWKLKKDGEYDARGPDAAVRAAFGDKMGGDDRVRIVDWLDCAPLAVLQSGNVVCSIHHGGASSYNEAILAGVPHVVLPFWTDCYEYANRVEFLGVGRKGARRQQPVFEAAELAEAVSEVIHGPRSEGMKIRARELAELCRENGSGPDIAAQGILKLATEAAALSKEMEESE
ncbi:diacylglycerol o-acyltransferase [Cordyceps fumosorosea ARSEF 2679]|uniref:Diacylglycerol o-acyltransferase n=1 Tax=Cordyceps fumosorosea (strain ARSEF 2679) TaxID=1081104 RepID=A0A167ZG88_CORFA|nr:diacylglycerol o-acyltransferase [Cordyceps fumosorosea ARSEF 2679]OAA67479.1 diacylglycerol o-acyltransferase [Cordyceps fumosorosea ARSEF 2679]